MDSDPRIGSQIASYRIERMLGRGGMGVVYLAEHVTLGRKAAVKVLTPDLAEDEEFRDRFLRESRMAGNLDQENVIAVYDAGEADGVLYIAMRYVEGSDLSQWLRTRGALSPEETLGILTQVAKALDAAHEEGLVHRDVKPANILLANRRRGNIPLVYLTDFGLTKKSDSHSRITKTGYFLGTLDYASPEQFRDSELDARTDVYALGCVLYECLTGEVPYARGSDAALMYAHCMEPPPRPREKRPELPPGTDAVISKAMAKEKEGRYESCGALIADLRRALDDPSGETVSLAPLTAPPPPPSDAGAPPTVTTPPPVQPAPERIPEPAGDGKRGGRGGLWIAALLILLLAGGAGAFFLTSGGDEPAREQTEESPTPPTDGGLVADGDLEVESEIAFASEVTGDAEIVVTAGDGSGSKSLTKEPSEESDPAWAPDGARIAFTSNREGNQDIFVLDVATREVLELVVDSSTDVSPAWSPDGERLAFVSDRGGSLDIFVVGADGSNIVQVTTKGSAETDPAWSPDGEKIAFVSERNGQTDLFEMNADGTKTKRITDDEIVEAAPVWSPDGATLGYHGGEGGEVDLFSVDVEGGVERLDAPGSTERNPTFSADGSIVVFESDLDGDFEIYAANPDGSEVTQLTSNDSDDTQPSVAPPEGLVASPTPTVIPTVVPSEIVATPTAEVPAAGPVGVTSPDEAALDLFSAWQSGDRSAASVVATEGAINGLFAQPPGSYEFMGCFEGSCGFRQEGSALSMTLGESEGGLFIITSVNFTAD